MEVKADDYQGKDRRNGGKLKLTTGDQLKLVAMGVAVISAFLWTQFTAMANANEIALVKQTPLKIAVMEEKLDNIEKDFDYFRVEQKEFRAEQKVYNIDLNKKWEILLDRLPGR